jgi:drug/metabolite transporter (DMT)-like permease
VTAPLAVPALLLNALVWGVSWLPFRHLDGLGMHGLWSTAIVYAAISVLIIGLRPVALAAVFRHPALWWLVLASGLTNACFNWAVTIGDVIRVVLLFYLMPVWAVLFARWLLAEPMTPSVLVRVVLGVAGAAVVLWPEGAVWSLPRGLSDWLAIAGGASFAATNVLLRRHAAVPAEGRALAMFAGGLVVAGGLGAVLATIGTIAPPTPVAWYNAAASHTLLPGVGPIAGLVLLASMLLVGNLALQYGAARLAASVTAVVMLTEILFASVSAMVWGGEVLTARTLVGGTMIVISAALAARD